ncbi:MAG: type I DNA topoisomerase [Candidatus Hydrothermota bacterium]|nr:MAG: type I DNA topoisomerase [Candidatus Hydrothermae bacterium]
MPKKKTQKSRKKAVREASKSSKPKKLLIVESPTKAKTIKRYLGDEFLVLASKGHIKDLPKSRFGVDIEHGFKPTYVTIHGKSSVIKAIKEAAKRADVIYLGSDPDREGEAIAYHVAQEVRKVGKNDIKRVLFYEITKDEVKKAIENPQEIDMWKVEAQLARRILDRIVGYKVSPLLWKAIHKGLSAGRVQTVALRLIVEREKEIQSFVPQKYWRLIAFFEKDGVRFKAVYQPKIEDEKEAKRLLELARQSEFVVKSFSKSMKSTAPPPPYKTSTLQQDASNKLGFSAKFTMRLAQELYEGVELPDGTMHGLITYMRTDSVRMADKAIAAIRKLVEEQFGKEYLPAKPRKHRDKGTIQGAHEAIRPTEFERTPDSLGGALRRELHKLYSLIWRRAVASQMASAKFEVRTAELTGNEGLSLRAEGKILKFDGFYRVLGDKPQDVLLPELVEGEKLKPVEVKLEEKETEPPKRYTEATLIKALEAKGIGRPSTYAPTIATLFEREYIVKDGRALKPTELGILVNDMLIPRFPELFDVNFTAKMEAQLDEVEGGKLHWQELLRRFYEKFSKELEKVESNISELKNASIQVLDEKCPVCGRPLVVRWGRYGKFIACSGYPECRYTRPINDIVEGVRCPKCGSQIARRRSKKGRIYYACVNQDCDFVMFNEPVGVKCPNCGFEIMGRVRKGRFKNKKIILRCPNCGFEMEEESS